MSLKSQIDGKTVEFIAKTGRYNRQNYQWSEFRGIPYAQAGNWVFRRKTERKQIFLTPSVCAALERTLLPHDSG